MTYSITDSFGGAAGVEITSHSTDQGYAWLRPAGGATGPFQTDGAGGIVDGWDSGAFAVVNAPLPDANYTVKRTINSANSAVLVGCDKDAAAATCYKAFWHAGAGGWVIQKLVAGSGSYLFGGAGASSYTPVGTGNTRHVALRRTIVSGNALLELLIEDVVRMRGTDSTSPITATGYGGISGTGLGEIVITGAGTLPGGNSAPVITSDGGSSTASISILENTTAVTTVTATDADGNTLTYSITGGADAARFSIDSSTGVLAFLSAPDYEIPTDADTNNVYVVIVQVSDGIATDSQTISVTVTNDAAEVAPARRRVLFIG